MSKRYVPDRTFLVCSDGMKVQQLKVVSQGSISIVGGKLAATEEDRTGGNFVCAKMVVAGAIIGAVAAGIVAAVVVGSGGSALLIGGIAAGGAVVGGGAGLGLGVIPCVCALLTMPNNWMPVHLNVSFEGKRPLMESSTIGCLLGGQIMIFYSQKAAQEAVDLRLKKTLADVGLVAATAFVSGAAFQGLVAAWGAGSGILSQFGIKAFGNYLGGVVYSGAGAFVGDWVADQGKNILYAGLGIKDEIDGYNTDITAYQFEGIGNAKVDQEESPTGSKLEDTVRTTDAIGKGSGISHTNTVSDNMTVEKYNFARLDDIEEYGPTTYRELGVDPNAIQGKKPVYSNTNNIIENQDFGGRYQDGYSHRTMYNQQYKMQDNSVKFSLQEGGGKQFTQGFKDSLKEKSLKGESPKESSKKRGAFLLSLLPDLYKLIINRNGTE